MKVYKLNYVLTFILIILRILDLLLTHRAIAIGEVIEINPIAYFIINNELLVSILVFVTSCCLVLLNYLFDYTKNSNGLIYLKISLKLTIFISFLVVLNNLSVIIYLINKGLL